MPNPRFEALTQQDVIRAARKFQPKEIQKWSVVVEKREYPVKQLNLTYFRRATQGVMW